MKPTTSAATLVLSLTAAAATSAQTLIQDQAQHLAVETQPAAGLAGGEIYSTLDLACIDDSGGALFRGRIFGGSAGFQNDRAYFYGADAQSMSLMVRSGDPEPSGTIPGATLNSAFGSGLSSAVRMSGNGTILFASAIDDGGVTIDSTNDSALFHGTPGNFQVLAREGDPAPGTLGATYSSSFSSLSYQQTALNDNGTALFRATLAGGDVVGDSNDQAWFKGTPGNVSIVAREGDAIGAGQIIGRISPVFISQINAGGLVLFDVEYVIGSGPIPVAESNNRALIAHFPSGVNVELMREGDPGPYVGANFAESTQFNWSPNTGGNTFNAQGEALVHARLDGDTDDYALVLSSLVGNLGVMRVGDAVPGLPGLVFEGFSSTNLALAQTGRIYFQGFFSGPEVTEYNDSAIFTGFPGAIELIAREGDVAPGTGGLEWSSLNGIGAYMNNVGQIIFSPSLTADPVFGPSYSSRWYYDPVDGLRILMIDDGTEVDLGAGMIEKPTSAAGIQFGNGGGRALSFQDDGTAALAMTYEFGIESVTKIRPEHLASSPAQVSVASGGTHTFQLSAGSSYAGDLFFLLGSASGTSPGTPVDGFLLPLNFDAFLGFSIEAANQAPFANTFGVLDELGRATASLTIPAGAPGLAGLALNFAYLSIDATTIPFLTSVSNATALTLTP